MRQESLKALSEDWLVEATLEDLQAKMEAGELTSHGLVLLYMERIATYDKSGPTFNSVLELNPDALFIAKALDVERAQKGPRGPLHGIPVLIKDNIDTGDKMRTSAGSIALANHSAKQDAVVAAKLREAGMVLLGKTNMTEWANFMAENMPGGYSSRGGQALNPYKPGDYSTGGSSAGAGVACAANFAAVTVGTETSGSILSPASQNNVVGIKPTVGLISRTGIIPICHTQDTAGPLARTVRDAAVLLGAMTGEDSQDPATWSGAAQAHRDYTPFLQADGLQGARIGVADFMELKEEESALFQAALEDLRRLGAEVIEGIEVATGKLPWTPHVMTEEFKIDLNAYLATCGPNVPVHSLEDLIAFNEAHAEVALRYGQKHLLDAQQTSGTLTSPDYIRELISHQTVYAQDIDDVLATHNLDALVYFSTWGCWLAARAGYPSVVVPSGTLASGEQAGLPVGLTFTASAYSEPKLIKLAYAYEQGTKHRKPPQL
ncbi:amidase family protein [Tumebacillus permanentifrigoris]|uniref:Amidase n=1 Tax=Tumebacillus permanentifrigoris TaxID=378543 RepID=A0A316DCV6_9BACL|nr:amidase family protein [Tumebacillus permanentifrigoris]PWK14343.1 amidase [Tumebacillus permanentifrigoris]